MKDHLPDYSDIGENDTEKYHVTTANGSVILLQNQSLLFNITHSNSTFSFNGMDPNFLEFLRSLLNPKNLLPEPLPDSLIVTFIVLYVLIIVLAVIGNIVVIIVIGKHRFSRSVTDMYIFSLAVSDILVASLNMPFQLYFVCANEWLAEGLAGEILCKFTNYVQGVTIVVCVLTLTVIALDRYVVICRPTISHVFHNKKSATICILGVWVLALCVLAPHLVFQKLDMRLKVSDDMQFQGTGWICAEFYPRGKKDGQLYSIFVYVLLYCVPVLIMVFTYGAIAHRLWFQRQIFPTSENPSQVARNVAQKKKITKLLIVLVLAFTILWLPFFTYSMYIEFLDDVTSSQRLKMAVLQLVGYSNCCVNPLIYNNLNNNFKREFRRMFTFQCRNSTVKAFKGTVSSVA